MSIASRFNKNNLFTYRRDENVTVEFKNLEKLVKDKDLKADNESSFLPIRALYVNKATKFGVNCTIACDDFNVSLPQHCTDIIKDLIADEEAVDAINNGLVGFSIRSYTDRNNKKRYTINFVDIE